MSDSGVQPEGQVDNWVFDSLVNFLHGSIWKAPVVGFIEEKSVALEQLWAAEDFTAFRRLMTRKNIDLQLQSLELLVAKYGVLSPSLRSGESEEPTGGDGEDDFLQVVIRYSDQLELFKCDYGSDGSTCPGRDSCNTSTSSRDKSHHEALREDDSKNMKLHLSGIHFKNNVAPKPVNYQASLVSSSTTSFDNNEILSPSQLPTITQAQDHRTDSINNDGPEDDGKQVENNEQSGIVSVKGEEEEEETTSSNVPVEEKDSNNESPKAIEPEPVPVLVSPEHTPPQKHSPSASPTQPEPEPTSDSQLVEDTDIAQDAPESSYPEPNQSSITVEDNNDQDNTNVEVEVEAESKESQLIQLEEAEAAIEEEGKLTGGDDPTAEDDQTPTGDIEVAPTEEPKETSPKQAMSPRLDEKTAVQIANSAPEQRRLLTAVRKALEINPEDSEPLATIEIPNSFDNDGDLQKRREYLRAQRDKLVAMKKQEREKLLLENSAAGGSQSSRPKSARAAQMAIKNPLNMRAASIGEKSLSARRALADRLKQELIEKQ